MYDVNDDAKGGYRRVEILTGPGRRRRWSAEEKSRIVEETLAPGARVSEVARRWQICPQQVFGWRRAARQDATPASATAPRLAATGFIPIVTEAAASVSGPAAVPRTPAPVIEVKLAGAVVRVVSGLEDGAQLTAVLRAVRASASRS
jgi:transposase